MSQAGETNDQRVLAGRYEIGEYIGQGGMATVYCGTDIKLGRKVAIKVMRPELADDEQFYSRFKQEAQSASRMAHPTIVRVLDAGDGLIRVDNGTKRIPFIVMEYVEGINLRDFMHEHPVSFNEAARIVSAVLTALEYSHRAGVVHRDIKPANIMITKSGQVKVMDFGIARAVSETSATLQRTTAILGTAAYFSPEQAKGENVDARTDLYSTAVLLYELLAGKVPFRGETAVAVAYQHVSERPQAPSKLRADIPAAFDEVVLYGLAKDRAKRFQNAAEFRAALAQAASGEMPNLPRHGAQEALMFSAGEELSEADLALRQLSEGGGSRAQSRPPVMWTWAAIITIGAIVLAVMFWVLSLVPRDITPSRVREVPAVVGESSAAAIKSLQKLDLLVVQIKQNSDTVPDGKVIKTDPAAGEFVNLGDEVTLYISAGPQTIEVPDYSGVTLESYTSALQKAGLTLGEVHTQDDPLEPKDRVIGVSPERGTQLRANSVVEVSVSSGRVNVPDLIGQPLDVAQTLVSGLGLSLKLNPQTAKATGCTVQNGYPVREQSIVGSNPQRSPLEISYCAG